MQPDFWHQRWSSDRIGFHQDRPSPLLVEHWAALALAADARVFVPLCGKSLDMVWLAERGHRILGVELAEIAIRQFFDELGLTPSRRTTAAGVHFSAGPYELICGDAFALEADVLADCAGLFDRAALIALPPALRRVYADTSWRRMPAEARGLLITLDYPQREKQGPPFAVGPDEVHALFDADWQLALLETRDILDREPGFVADGVTALSTRAWRVARRGEPAR
ncbi:MULTISPECIES: thiopurine S-methyltransferase [Luteimonas]|uniref:thiopurine S-methyltransferase n=1 Tax=Luteimonas TaxID=83614 RepID=UPI000C7A5754|nr:MULTISPECIES: thiopurine S-methyltransferase [Luteimonas]